MNRAFVREQDDEKPPELPDRPISSFPNFVTREGFAAIDAHAASSREELATAQAADDRIAIARAMRDLRYWSARRASAEIVDPPADGSVARFGSVITIRRGEGREQTYRIVGEDEADPTHGTLSHASPLAQAILGKSIDEDVIVNGAEIQIVAIA